jgi:glycerophosphoryl diester phosphodiesterase
VTSQFSVLLAASTLGIASSAGAVTLNVGHRGFSEAFPENTLIALEQAFVAGAEVVEIDLQKSADGHVVIFHDDTVDRTTNGSGNVADLTLAELRSLDAGSWFAPEFSDERIPTLDEALLAAQGRGPLLLDQKSDLLFGTEIAATLLATGVSARDVWVTAWNEDQVADVVGNLPGVSILWTAFTGPSLGTTDPPLSDFLTQMAQLGVDGFSFISQYYDLLEPDFLAEAQSQGFLGFAWDFTPQTRERMETMLRLGLDGYIVNDVAAFESVIPEPRTALLVIAGLAVLALAPGALLRPEHRRFCTPRVCPAFEKAAAAGASRGEGAFATRISPAPVGRLSVQPLPPHRQPREAGGEEEGGGGSVPNLCVPGRPVSHGPPEASQRHIRRGCDGVTLIA